MASAKSAERELMNGQPLGLLHGIPFTVKDIVNTKGVRTTFGAVPYKENVPDDDAVAVARLRAQGGLLLGKTTTPEFGSKCLTNSAFVWPHPQCLEPLSVQAAAPAAEPRSRLPGGGIAPLAIATDGGGSTRIPGFLQRRRRTEAEQRGDPPQPGARRFRQSNLRNPDDAYGRGYRFDDASDGRRRCFRSMVDRGLPEQISSVARRRAVNLRGRKILFCLTPPGRPVLGGRGSRLQGGSYGAGRAWCGGRRDGWRRIRSRADLARHQSYGLARPVRKLAADHHQVLSPTFLKQLSLAEEVWGIAYQQAMFDRTSLFRRVQSLLQRADMLAMPTLSRTALPIDQDLFGTIEIDRQVLNDVRPHWFPSTISST